MKLLETAIRESKVVSFQYTNNENVTKLLKVEPVRLEFKWYSWYLIAFSPKHQDYCMLKLVRMEKVAILDERCEVVHDSDTKQITLQDHRKTITVTLHGKANIKMQCKEYLNGQITQEFENGDFEFCFTVPEQERYWYGVILSFGKDATIIAPESVIERLLTTCGEVRRNYGKE